MSVCKQDQGGRLTFPSSEGRILQVMLTFYGLCTIVPWIITVASQITEQIGIGLGVVCSGELFCFAICKLFSL